MRTVLVTGANGQLGSRLMENPGQSDLRIVGFDRDELDITSPESIAEALKNHQPGCCHQRGGIHGGRPR